MAGARVCGHAGGAGALASGHTFVAHLDAMFDKGLRLDVCVAHSSVEGLGRLAQWLDGMDPNDRTHMMPRKREI